MLPRDMEWLLDVVDYSTRCAGEADFAMLYRSSEDDTIWFVSYSCEDPLQPVEKWPKLCGGQAVITRRRETTTTFCGCLEHHEGPHIPLLENPDDVDDDHVWNWAVVSTAHLLSSKDGWNGEGKDKAPPPASGMTVELTTPGDA